MFKVSNTTYIAKAAFIGNAVYLPSIISGREFTRLRPDATLKNRVPTPGPTRH